MGKRGMGDGKGREVIKIGMNPQIVFAFLETLVLLSHLVFSTLLSTLVLLIWHNTSALLRS